MHSLEWTWVVKAKYNGSSHKDTVPLCLTLNLGTLVICMPFRVGSCRVNLSGWSSAYKLHSLKDVLLCHDMHAAMLLYCYNVDVVLAEDSCTSSI